MKKTNIQELKKLYEEEYNKKNALMVKLNEYNILRQCETVKRFLKLNEELEGNYDNLTNLLNKTTDKVLIKNCLEKLEINEPINVFVCMGLLIYKYEDKTFMIYRNIENGIDFNIPISKKNEFEENNTVIYLKGNVTDEDFYRIQYEYLKNLILYSENFAINDIKKLSRK